MNCKYIVLFYAIKIVSKELNRLIKDIFTYVDYKTCRLHDGLTSLYTTYYYKNNGIKPSSPERSSLTNPHV